MFYRIPANLPSEIAELEGQIASFQAGTLDAGALKARRVPFGCYEQRKDGAFMLRIRATGGAITPAQLAAIARAAIQFGSGFIHITTREEFQIHDLALGDVIAAMRALLAAGLSTRGGGGNTVRNIMVSPGAGIDRDEVFDPSPCAFALTTRLIAEGDSWLMPRKLKITFSNSPADTAFAQFNDLGFIACLRDGERGFRVYVAGGFGGKPSVGHLLHDFIPVADVYRVAEAVKRLFYKHGNRKNRNAARLRFLWSSLGEERFRELYEEERRALEKEDVAPFVVEDTPTEVQTPPAPSGGGEDPAFSAWRERFVTPQRPELSLIHISAPPRLARMAGGGLGV